MKINIVDDTKKKCGHKIESILNPVFSIVASDDLVGLDKIILRDECQTNGYKECAGFYYSARQNQNAWIELYPEKSFAGIPFFLPKIRPFKRFSIIKIFLHELGHHKNGYIADERKREIEAEHYADFYLRKIYGELVGFFYCAGAVDSLLKRIFNIST